VGLRLQGQLPSSPRHPKGRNAYAHIAKVIKSVFGKSYKDVEDDRFKSVMGVIEYCERNPF